jgi:hypothetical protein
MSTTNQIEIKKYITPDIKKKMTKWEKEFITSIYYRKETWTLKQVEVFNNIKKKYQLNERVVVERIIYAPTAYAKGAKYQQDITTRKMRKNRSTGRKLP